MTGHLLLLILTSIVYREPENKEIPNFSDPQVFLIHIVQKFEIGPLANFEPFWYTRTFKKSLKVENRAKKFSGLYH